MSQDYSKPTEDYTSGTEKKNQDGDEESIDAARRKALSHVVPMALGAFIKAQETLTPISLASRAVDHFDDIAQQQLVQVQRFLRKKLPEMDYTDLGSDGGGLFSFTTTRDSVLSGAVSQYLRMKHAEESAFAFPFRVLPAGHEALDSKSYDCELALSQGSVFGKLTGKKPTLNSICSLQSEAIRANHPSEIWVFVTSGLEKSDETDLLIDPIFATDKRFLPGRLMVIGLGTVFAEVIGEEKYSVQNIESKTTSAQSLPNQQFKITLSDKFVNIHPSDKRRVA